MSEFTWPKMLKKENRIYSKEPDIKRKLLTRDTPSIRAGKIRSCGPMDKSFDFGSRD